MVPLTLVVLEGRYIVCRLPPDSELPAMEEPAPFFSITRTREELSIVCPERSVPYREGVEGGWTCLRIAGRLDFSLVGVLASVLAPLAEAGIPVFVTSTFDTDYFMIKDALLESAIRILRRAGHQVIP